MSGMPTRFSARAPVRVDCAGGGTDCPPFSVDYGGTVVNCGIQLYARASIEMYPGPEIDIVSHDFGITINTARLSDLRINGELDLLKAIALRMNPDFGFRFSVQSEVPPGSGLGSSGAVGVACVAAFDAAMGTRRSPEEIARLANDIERKDLGHPGGDQDSFGPALGGFNLLNYHVGGGMTPEKIIVSDETTAELERRAFLVYTGEPHLSGNIHRDIKDSYILPESPTVDAMKNLARIGNECASALEHGEVDRFGRLLSENWVHHKRLHPSCNCEQLQRFYDALEDAITGGKTCGAGGGGCILFLAKPGKTEHAKDICQELGGQVLPFRVSPAGVCVNDGG